VNTSSWEPGALNEERARERARNNCCGKNMRYREASSGEIKPRAG